MINADYFKENFTRTVADSLDKYGRGWQDATVVRGDIIDSLELFEVDADMITPEQSDRILETFANFIRTLDNVYNEIK